MYLDKGVMKPSCLLLQVFMDNYMTQEQYDLSLDEHLNEEMAQREEMSDSQSYFIEGMDSDELPSEKYKRRQDQFFPNHF